MQALSFHPFQRESLDDPYPRFAQLRRERPISSPWPGLHVVVRDAEVRAVLDDAALWSNRRHQSGFFSVEQERRLALSQLDAPDHTRLRTLFRPAFVTAMLSALQPRLEAVADALAAPLGARLQAGRTIDLVSDFALPFAARGLESFLGVEPAHRVEFQRWAACFRDLVSQQAHPEWPRFRAWALRGLSQGDASGNTVFAVLRSSVRRGVDLHEDELVAFLHFLIVAGVPNVQHALGNLVLRLLREERWHALPDEEAQLGNVVEEGLRLDPPALWQMRTATCDTSLLDVRVLAGERVIAVTASANRDALRWAEPERFDPSRADLRAHLAFGRGPHACLGAALARLELRVALRVLRTRLRSIALAPEFRFQRAGDFISRGPAALPVVPSQAPARGGVPTRWLHRPDPRPAATTMLVCCPHAGGSAAPYYAWTKRLPPSVELLAVQYPARMERLREPHPGDMHTLVEELSRAIRSLSGTKRIALFGHSMGASVAFEVARELERSVRVAHLFVSGRPGPALQRQGDVHLRDDEGLLSELLRLGGTQRELLANAELRGLVLPALRADYALIETYRAAPLARVRCPIAAFTGDRDPEADEPALRAWRDATDGPFSLTLLPGDHFYLVPQADALIAHLLTHLGEKAAVRGEAFSLP